MARRPDRARLGTLFRDRDELPSAGDLGGTIREALDRLRGADRDLFARGGAIALGRCQVEAFRHGRPDRVSASLSMANRERDPAQQCFPPACQRRATASLEPLAADARPEGDGKERAFLKLVAGLLGVGYDALVQRETQRRNRRLAWSRRRRSPAWRSLGAGATAHVARNDAQRRQAQAEDILGFMLGDLRKKLTTVGPARPDARGRRQGDIYFAELDPRDLSDRALEEQARSLTGIGQVRLEEGNHDAAMRAFREAYARTTALVRARGPGNGQRLFDRAQAEYWIGYVAWQQGASTKRTLAPQYRDSALQLAAMDRENFDWQKEVAYGYHNLAVLEESRGRYAEAERAMRSEAATLYRAWVRRRPNDLRLRFEAANTAPGWAACRCGKAGWLTRKPFSSSRRRSCNATLPRIHNAEMERRTASTRCCCWPMCRRNEGDLQRRAPASRPRPPCRGADGA